MNMLGNDGTQNIVLKKSLIILFASDSGHSVGHSVGHSLELQVGSSDPPIRFQRRS